MDKKKFIKKFLIWLLALNIVTVITFFILYKLEFTLKNISNSIFIVNISVFSIALILQTGATRTFIPMSYTLQTWFNYKKTKEKYNNFKEYFDDNEKKHVKEVRHVLLSTSIMILTAIILSIFYITIS